MRSGSGFSGVRKACSNLFARQASGSGGIGFTKSRSLSACSSKSSASTSVEPLASKSKTNGAGFWTTNDQALSSIYACSKSNRRPQVMAHAAAAATAQQQRSKLAKDDPGSYLANLGLPSNCPGDAQITF